MMRFKILCVLFVVSTFNCSAQEPIREWISNYYGSINNLGDVEILSQHRDELQSVILSDFFQEMAVVADDLRNGMEFRYVSEYMDNLRLDYKLGFKVWAEIIGNIYFNPDGDLIIIVRETFSDLAKGIEKSANYHLVLSCTVYNLTTFKGKIKSISRYKSKIDKRSELEKQKEAEDLEIDIWNWTERLGTKKGFEEYMLSYPKSRFREKALDQITALNLVDEKERIYQDSLYNARNEKFTLAQQEKYDKSSLELQKLETQLSIEKLKKENSSDGRQEFLESLNERMILVDGGIFTLGCESSDCKADESPTSSKVVKSFYMGKFEVTVEEWKMVVGELPSEFSNVDCSKCPVSNVTYFEVIDFLSKLNEIDGGNFRLPLEHEWEYAALGGEDFRYAGSNIVEEAAEYRDNNGIKSVPVVSTKENGYGLCGMSGNVSEWCEDWYTAEAYGLEVSPESGEHKVVRGGSFVDRENNVRIKSRSKSFPAASRQTIGFRIVKDN